MKGKKPKWLQRRLNRRSAHYNDQFNPANGEPHSASYNAQNRWVRFERWRKKEEKWAAILGRPLKWDAILGGAVK